MVEGSCLCGAIKYSVELNPDMIFNCHCQFCRKAHGADYVTVAIANGSTVILSDEKHNLREHLNDIGGYRAFCGNCGTRLMNSGPDKTAYLGIVFATIDTATDLTPVAHVNTESKAKWCTPYAGIPAYQKLPDIVG